MYYMGMLEGREAPTWSYLLPGWEPQSAVGMGSEPPPTPRRPKSRVAVTRGNSRFGSSPPHSVLPEITKPLGGQFRVAHRVLNMAMPEILLDGAGIDAFVREVKTTGMAQHMGMDRKGELRVQASAQKNMADGAS